MRTFLWSAARASLYRTESRWGDRQLFKRPAAPYVIPLDEDELRSYHRLRINLPPMSIPKAFLELVADAKTRIREVALDELRTISDGGVPLLIDVREEVEWNSGHAQGAIHLSRGIIEQKIGDVAPDLQAPIVCYCGGGNRSALVVDSLRKLGYTNAASLLGGFDVWKQAGLPVSTDQNE